MHLDALKIIFVPLLAGRATLAGGGARVVHTAALPVPGDSAARSRAGGSGRGARSLGGGLGGSLRRSLDRSLRNLDRSRRRSDYCAARSLSGGRGGGGGSWSGGLNCGSRRTAAVGASCALESRQDGIVGRLLLQVLIPRKGSTVTGEGRGPVGHGSARNIQVSNPVLTPMSTCQCSPRW